MPFQRKPTPLLRRWVGSIEHKVSVVTGGSRVLGVGKLGRTWAPVVVAAWDSLWLLGTMLS